MALDQSLLRIRLEQSLDSGVLLGLHSDSDDPDKFTLGWIVGLSDTCYSVAAVDEVGRRDEFQIGYLEDLFKVVTGGHYIDSLARLMINHPPQTEVSPPAADIKLGLLSAARERAAVSLYHRSGLTIQGFVLEIDEDFVEVESFTLSGLAEGRQIVRMVDVSRLALGGPDQHALVGLMAVDHGS